MVYKRKVIFLTRKKFGWSPKMYLGKYSLKFLSKEKYIITLNMRAVTWLCLSLCFHWAQSSIPYFLYDYCFLLSHMRINWVDSKQTSEILEQLDTLWWKIICMCTLFIFIFKSRHLHIHAVRSSWMFSPQDLSNSVASCSSS